MSLPEQRSAIERYAVRAGLAIVEWFEERETAAKRGRPVWSTMLRRLRAGAAAGVVIHKIDRSARNLRDWADLGELIDQGLEVHFANEALDLHSRGGRLSADIQAVVAADYIRNLREEAKKGIYGRLKQGFYPMRAPIGYLDHGAAKPKTIDPVKGPLVREAFDLYGTGRWNLRTLAEELNRRGLRYHGGGMLSVNSLDKMLRNPFYTGVIRLRKSGETFEGNHEALIPKSLFEGVQAVLHGRIGTRVQVYDFAFRRLVKCACCGRSLIGETRKGHVYYRCHTRTCPPTSVREPDIDALVERKLRALEFNPEERACFSIEIETLQSEWIRNRNKEIEILRARAGQLTERLNRLTDAYLEGTIDRDLYEERKVPLIEERRALSDRCADFEANRASVPDEIRKFVGLAGSAYSLYKNASTEKKRRMLRLIMSDCTADRKAVDFVYYVPFRQVADREKDDGGGPGREMGRTPARTIARLVEYFGAHPNIELSLEE